MQMKAFCFVILLAFKLKLFGRSFCAYTEPLCYSGLIKVRRPGITAGKPAINS